MKISLQPEVKRKVYVNDILITDEGTYLVALYQGDEYPYMIIDLSTGKRVNAFKTLESISRDGYLGSFGKNRIVEVIPSEKVEIRRLS